MKAIDEELFGITHRKQRINSKRKGNANELTLTKVLTAWTNEEWVRIPGSGNIRWQNRMNVCGDLICTNNDFDFPFSIETKHVKSLGLDPETRYTLRVNSVIFTYYAQCERDAKVVNKIPLLIIRENGMGKNCYYVFLSLHFDQLMKISNYTKAVLASHNPNTIWGFKSEEFFKKVSLETLKFIYDRKSSSSK